MSRICCLSRAAVREREVTVRMALGASGGRLVRQLLTESVLLSLLGGVAGVLLAVGGLRVLRAVAPSDLPRMDGVGVNATVLLVTSIVTLATGMIFGLVPAMQSSRTRLSETLRDGGRGGTSGRAGQRLRRTIVAAQLALVVVLLTGAGLLIRTFVTLQGTSLGFETRGVLTMNVQLPRAKYNQQQGAALYRSFLDRVRAIPGVREREHGHDDDVEHDAELHRRDGRGSGVARRGSRGDRSTSRIPISSKPSARGSSRVETSTRLTATARNPSRSSTSTWRNTTGRAPARSASGSYSAARILTARRVRGSPSSAWWRTCGAPASTCRCAMNRSFPSRRIRRSATSW